MELSWEDAAWKPTAGAFDELGPWDKPSKAVFTTLKAQLQKDAKNLRFHPHEPKFWFARGETLLGLGYPELAAGDFEKTLLLLEYGLEYSPEAQSELGQIVSLPGLQKWIKEYRGPGWALRTSTSSQVAHQSVVDDFKKLRKDTYLKYLDALYLLRAIPDFIQLCKGALKHHPEDSDLLDQLEEGEDLFSSHAAHLQAKEMSLNEYAWGMLPIKLYPWTPPELLTRDTQAIASANQMLSRSDSLEIRPSTFGGFGMFAKCDIKKGEKILDAPCASGVSSNPSNGPYCYNCAAKRKTIRVFDFGCCPSMRFCSKECRVIASTNYHSALCGKDFSDLYKAASSNDFLDSTTARDTLLFLRLFAISLKAGTHPLATPPIGWITANYEAQSPMPWSRSANIQGPIKILQKLGVNIFADEYDTWALQTLWNRARNNSRTHQFLRQVVVNPLYSFFNHSCDPSTLDQTELSSLVEKTSRSVMIATKDVKAGEEVCTTYAAPNVLRMPKAMRHQFLSGGSWFGPKGCECKRCLAETR